MCFVCLQFLAAVTYTQDQMTVLRKQGTHKLLKTNCPSSCLYPKYGDRETEPKLGPEAKSQSPYLVLHLGKPPLMLVALLSHSGQPDFHHGDMSQLHSGGLVLG